MPEIGYALSSEEHGPKPLIQYAGMAEQAGFSFAVISDHFHPWTDRQGNSPFAWSVLGGIAQATQKMRLGTAVTCPTMRYSPAIIAQAAATIACMAPGRFFLGVGTGENLNEHILGDHWPPSEIRLEMLNEAVEIIRSLWQGKEVDYYGSYFTIENARVYTLPDEPPPIYMASSGVDSARLAGEISDGLMAVAPDKELVSEFNASGGAGKPTYGQIKVCWAETEDQARKVVQEWWPVSAVPGTLHSELPTPAFFEDAVQDASVEQMTKHIVLGNDKEKHLAEIRKMADAGFEHIFIHQIGPDQEGFFRFYQREILPAF